MPSFSCNYLLPAILLNPPFILHLINTFASHMLPPPTTVSHSPNPFLESLGPTSVNPPYLDIHADEQLCWGYTAVMVLAQILAFGSVSDNRTRRKTAKAAKLERERLKRERMEEELRAMVSKNNTHVVGLDGVCGHPEEHDLTGVVIGKARRKDDGVVKIIMREIESEESESSMTETSEEEIFS